MAIVGPNTFVPINSFAKKQGAVSHSSTESEIIFLEEGLRTEALPILTFWEHVVQLFGTERSSSPGGRTNQRQTAAMETIEENEMLTKDSPKLSMRSSCSPSRRSTTDAYKQWRKLTADK